MEFTRIYPNQLFHNHPSLSKKRKILLIEDPLFFGDEEYIVPASGRSLRLPCSFLFWFLALIFWAMAVKVEDDDSII